MENKTPLYPFRCHTQLKQLLDDYWSRVKQARANGIKTVYAIGHAPTDIAVAMGFLPILPENHSTMCAAAKVATYHCQVAEDNGYSPDLCSYSKNDFGSHFAGPKTKSPIGGVPKPDLMIATTACNTHVKWFEDASRRWNIPLLVLDVPYVHDGLSAGDVTRRVKYAERQLKEHWVPFLEDYCHRPYDWDKLEETVALTAKAGQMWSDIVHSARHVPSPVTCFDLFLHLGALVTLRGYPQAISYYDLFKAEIDERIAQNFSAVGTEKHRLYWDNLPVWFKFSYLARKFAAHQSCLTTAVYLYAWIEVFALEDARRPLESMAEAQTLPFINRGTQHRIDMVRRLVEEFSIDGLVTQSSRTCKLFVPDQMAVMKAVQQMTGLPMVTVEGDMVDERFFSDSKTDSAIDTFMEELAATRRNDGAFSNDTTGSN